MAKIRLNLNDRYDLIQFMQKKVVADKILVKKEQESYNKAKPFVLKSVKERFPTKDMKILSKYGCAWPDQCIKVVDLDDKSRDIVQFKFKEKDAPLVSEPTWKTPPYEITKEGMVAVKEWVEAEKERVDDLKKRRDAYRVVINSSRNLEDVIDIWPEAEELREQITGRKCQNLIPLKAIDIVRKDLSKRSA